MVLATREVVLNSNCCKLKDGSVEVSFSFLNDDALTRQELYAVLNWHDEIATIVQLATRSRVKTTVRCILTGADATTTKMGHTIAAEITTMVKDALQQY